MRPLGGGRTFGNDFLGAMKFQQADMAELGRDRDIRRLTGEPAAGNSVLQDVEGLDHDAEQAWRTILSAEDILDPAGKALRHLPLEMRHLAQQVEAGSTGYALAGCAGAAQQIPVQIDRD